MLTLTKGQSCLVDSAGDCALHLGEYVWVSGLFLLSLLLSETEPLERQELVWFLRTTTKSVHFADCAAW